MPEIPTQLRFEEMLSHTFPGLFSALTMFMLIDIWSPYNLTLRANRDIASVLAFAGFVVVLGTILGVLIDGIHHSVIEDSFFKKLTGLRKIEVALRSFYPADIDDGKFRHYYFSPKIGDKAIDIFDHLTTTTYRYSEFDANSFIALVPFSFVTPFFLVDVLHIPWIWSVSIGLALLITAFYCLKNSYDALKEYRKYQYSVICGYLDYNYYIDIRTDLFKWDSATGSDKQRLLRFLRNDHNISFTENVVTTLENNKISCEEGKNTVDIYLDGNKEKMELKINDREDQNLEVKEEEGHLKIYKLNKKHDFKEYYLDATIYDKISKMPVSNKWLSLIFKTTLGDIIIEKNFGKTDSDGVVRAILRSNKSGIAIITATSEYCIPGVACMKVRV